MLHQCDGGGRISSHPYISMVFDICVSCSASVREREQGRSDVRDGDVDAIGDHGILIYTQYIQLNVLDL